MSFGGSIVLVITKLTRFRIHRDDVFWSYEHSLRRIIPSATVVEPIEDKVYRNLYEASAQILGRAIMNLLY
jgi:hypothetical protein